MARHVRLLVLWCLVFASQTCFATSELFIFTKAGIWFASDTLSTHYGQRYTVCKAYLSPNRIMFSTGSFRELDQMPKDLESLPNTDLDSTVDAMLDIVGLNLQDMPSLVPSTPLVRVMSLGLIQFRDGTIEAKMGALADDHVRRLYKTIDAAKFGVPRGFGTKQVDDRTKKVEGNPALAAEIAKHPKRELLRLLNSEAAEPGTNVGGPFTVLFMDRKGLLKDYSDNHVCVVP